MDTSQWPQEMVMKPMEEIIPKPCNSNPLERKVRPQKDQALNCPRCNSTNTKFCYYNNYNLSQPRYFCKTCRRYWTEGGTLRNIPVGGGSRKNKRSSSSVASSTNSSIAKKMNNPQDLTILPPPIMSQNPNKIHEGQDLNLGFPPEHDFKSFTELIQAPNFDNHRHYNSKENMPSSTSSSHQLSAMELLTGITPSSRGFNSFIPIMPPQVGDQNNGYSSSSGFSMPIELKPSLDFSLYGLGTNNSGFGGGLQNVHHQDNGNERFLFPFEDLNLKQATTTTSNATTDHHQHVQQSKGQNGNTNHENSSGYWNNGVLGGGTW